MKIQLLVLITLFGLIQVNAQETLPSSEVEVIKDFEARLVEASKLKIKLNHTEVDTSRTFIDKYVLTEGTVELEYPKTQIKPLAMPRGERSDSYKAYLEGGYGLPNAPFAMGSYYYDGNTFDIEANASFMAFKDSDVESKSFMDLKTDIDAYWAVTDMLQLNIGGGYNQKKRYFYAGATEEQMRDSLERKFSNPHAHIGIKNVLSTKRDIDYSFDYHFIPFKDNLGNKELNNNFHANISRTFAEGSAQIGLDVDADLSKLEDTSSRDLNNYFFTPSLVLGNRDWNLKGGVSLGILDGELNFFPQFEFAYPVSTMINPYLGVRSGALKNNFYNLMQMNPYLAVQVDTISNQHFMDFYVGVRGGKDIFSYAFKLDYNKTKSNALFLNTDSSDFKMVLDDIDIFSIQLNGNIQLMPDLMISLDLKKHFFNTDIETEAWHKPTFEIHLRSEYTQLLNQKLAISADIFTLGGITYIEQNSLESKTLDPVFDASIRFTYSFNEQAGIYAGVNNIADSKNSRFHRYDAIGINPQIGAFIQF